MRTTLIIALSSLVVACSPSELELGAGEIPAFADGEDITAFQETAGHTPSTKARTAPEVDSDVTSVERDTGCDLYYGYFLGSYGGGRWEGEFTDLSKNWLADAKGGYYDDYTWDGKIDSNGTQGSLGGDWGVKVFKGDIRFPGVTDAVVSGGYEDGEFAGLWTACI